MEKDGDNIVFVATDETMDRHGEVIPMDSWDTENYERAPRLLVDHDHRVEKIVGKAENIKKTAKRMTFTPLFHGITEVSRETEAMVKQGFLDTVSVGFIPHEKTNELVEISFVTVPANPNAARIKSLLDESETTEQKALVEKYFDVKEFEGTMRFKGTEVQTLVFSKEKFDTSSAKKWATDHAFAAVEVEEKDSTIRIEQFSAEKCVDGSMRTFQLEEGVKALVCRNDEQKCLDKQVTVEDKQREKQPQALSPEQVVAPAQKGRSLSKEERAHKIMREAMKQTARIMNHALMEINRQ